MANREVLLPFHQVVRMPTDCSFEVHLSGTGQGSNSSGAQTLMCNYVSVEPVKSAEGGEAAPSKGYYRVIPTGTKNTVYASPANNPSSITVSGLTGSEHFYDDGDQAPVGNYSGAPAGAGAGVIGGPTTLTTLSLQNAHTTSSVTIHSHFDTSCLMLVTYGVVVPKVNYLRDGNITIGS